LIADAIVWGIWFRRRSDLVAPSASARGTAGEVWGYRGAVRSRAADNTIFRLRAKIERSPARPRHVSTVQGEGYRFEA